MNRLLLLHGFTGTPGAWDPVLAAVPPSVSVLRPYLVGHGTPATALDVNSFEAEVDRLARLLARDATPSTRTLVAGYSFGARLAAGLCVRHPQAVSGALWISGSVGLPTEDERAARRDADARWIELLEQRGLEAFIERWERQPLFATQSLLPPERRAEERARRRAHTARGLAHALAVAGLGRMPDYLPELHRVRVPVTLLVGSLDTRFVALARTIAAELPSAQLTELPETGHNLLLERPDQVADAIVNALGA
ncbi:MAG: alpha/beta fold hydrolase [Pseudomonadota bacterium]|nr:MAG: 2-succinyl-6-hydroxy-2,4-cyclohexadiene-1-carboxylate synthase [Pseudomonadota bacterium]